MYHQQAGFKRVIVRLWLSIWTAIAIVMMSAIAQPLVAQQDSNPLLPLQLPNAAPHPLPSSLDTWVDLHNVGDYFDNITPFGFGYLVWSRFPVQVYLDSGELELGTVPSAEQRQNWHQAMSSAVQEWNQFIPLEISDRPDHADIIVLAQTPPLRWPTSSLQEGSDVPSQPSPLVIPRAQTAETTYNIALAETNDQMVMKQQYTIQLAPNQSLEYLEATARHELGHALGIWGHSPVQEDVLYFSQVQTPPSISARDINTLKKIYQQPTQLGWPLIGAE